MLNGGSLRSRCRPCPGPDHDPPVTRLSSLERPSPTADGGKSPTPIKWHPGVHKCRVQSPARIASNDRRDASHPRPMP